MTFEEYVTYIGSFCPPVSEFLGAIQRSLEMPVLESIGAIDRVKQILKNNPTFDVNGKGDGEYSGTALHYACSRPNQDGIDTIISLLLAHPDIDVNVINSQKRTPFQVACDSPGILLLLLLKDARTRLSQPFSSIALKWIIASGRRDWDPEPGWKSSPLLQNLEKNPEEARDAMRKELKITGESPPTF